jgi:hypothetical protein
MRCCSSFISIRVAPRGARLTSSDGIFTRVCRAGCSSAASAATTCTAGLQRGR